MTGEIAAATVNADDTVSIDGFTGDVVGRHNLRPHTVLLNAVTTRDKSLREVRGADLTKDVSETVLVVRPHGANRGGRDKTFRLSPQHRVRLLKKGATERAAR